MSSIFEIVENINKCQFFSGSIRQNEPLSQRTTMKVGGNADLFICPSDSNSVVIATSILKKNRIPFFVLGGGSNVVAPDNGFRGAIISTENLNGISHETTDKAEKITFGSGTPTKDAVEYTCSRGISGLERFAGLPGTCGGAAFMNARCYNADFGNLIESISYIDLDSVTENYEESLEKSVRTYSSNFETDWSYKKSPFTGKNTVILSVKMKFSLADPSKAGNLEKECRNTLMTGNQRVTSSFQALEVFSRTTEILGSQAESSLTMQALRELNSAEPRLLPGTEISLSTREMQEPRT